MAATVALTRDRLLRGTAWMGGAALARLSVPLCLPEISGYLSPRPSRLPCPCSFRPLEGLPVLPSRVVVCAGWGCEQPRETDRALLPLLCGELVALT